MKLFFSVIFFSGIVASACAQNEAVKATAPKDSVKKAVSGGFTLPVNMKYKLPDGKIVSQAGFDSARKSWGGMFSMGHDTAHPDIVSVFPITAADIKKSAEDKARQQTLLNQPAPEFDLKDLGGKHYDLKELKGKVVVLNFWFIGCVPCQAEMPELNAIRSQFDLSKVVFLSLGLDNADNIRKFLKTTRFEYTALADAKAVHKTYRVASCPTSIVIDEMGMVRFIQITGQDINETLSAAIKAVITQ